MLDNGRNVVDTIDTSCPGVIRKMVEGAFQVGFISIGAVAGSIGGAVGAFVGGLIGNVVWSMLPGWVKNPMIDFIANPLITFVKKACSTLRGWIDQLDRLVPWIGGPQVLRDADAKMDELVGTPTLALRDAMSSAVLAGVWSWDAGPASRLYPLMKDKQIRELDIAQGSVDSLRGVLRSMADSIEKFNLGIIQVATGLLEVVVGLAATIVGWSTIVVGVLGIITAVIGLVTVILGVIELVQSSTQDSRQSINAAKDAVPPKWDQCEGFPLFV